MAGDLPTRLEGENELQYHKRLIYGKVVDKTLSDVDYSELAPLIYGGDYSSETTRKMLYGSVKTLQLMDRVAEDELSSRDLIELENKRLELQKEKQRFFDQRREYKKLVTAESRFEHLTERLVQAVDTLPPIQITNCVAEGRGPIATDKTEAVLVLADWHYGMVTDNIFNKFNKEIFEERVNTLVGCVVDKLLKNNVTVLHIILLGDMIHGGIHVNARVASDELVCDQLIQVSECLADVIATLSGYVIRTEVHSTYGNHARIISEKTESIHRDNMERIIPWWIQQRLQNHSDITVCTDECKEFISLNVCGNEIVATHGDLDDVKAAPKQIYTMFGQALNKKIDYVILGHRHHHEVFDDVGVTAIGCGCLCGTDEYSNSRRLYSKPEQLMLIFSERNKCLEAEYHLDVSREYSYSWS